MNEGRFAGALLGTFSGDALGMPFEGRTHRQIQKQVGRVDRMIHARLGAGTYTDDTEMMIAVAESLMECRGFDGLDMARRFVDGFNPERGYGRGTVLALAQIKRGVPWREAGLSVFSGGSYGNGAAMRIAPIALVYTNDELRR